MRKISKRGDILTENIIFIVLNIMFLAILILFLFSRMGNAAILEEKYSKQIALFLDSAKPGMTIHLNMEDAIEIAEKEFGEGNVDNLVIISGNIITVRFQEGEGYSYSFFNNVDATAYLDKTNYKEYVFVIDEK